MFLTEDAMVGKRLFDQRNGSRLRRAGRLRSPGRNAARPCRSPQGWERKRGSVSAFRRVGKPIEKSSVGNHVNGLSEDGGGDGRLENMSYETEPIKFA
jgi:hypothetical protein